MKTEEQEPQLAKAAIDRIRELDVMERAAKERSLAPDAVRELRRTEALPHLAALRDWMTVTRAPVLDKGALAKVIDYALSSWTALCRRCDDGGLEIDNNGSERSLRTVAVGRKNWIFFRNERGGRTAAVIYSLSATCKKHDVDPRAYLRDVLLRISKVSDVRELTPHDWKAKWAPIVEAHRASIVERVLAK